MRLSGGKNDVWSVGETDEWGQTTRHYQCDCGWTTDDHGTAVAHHSRPCEEPAGSHGGRVAAGLRELRADVEEAIWAARLEGYAEAADQLQRMSDEGFTAASALARLRVTLETARASGRPR